MNVNIIYSLILKFCSVYISSSKPSLFDFPKHEQSGTCGFYWSALSPHSQTVVVSAWWLFTVEFATSSFMGFLQLLQVPSYGLTIGKWGKASASGCLSLFVALWLTIRLPSPSDSWDGLQSTSSPQCRRSRYRTRMDLYPSSYNKPWQHSHSVHSFHGPCHFFQRQGLGDTETPLQLR